MPTQISAARDEIAANLSEDENLFTEVQQFYYAPRGTNKTDIPAVRTGPFDIGLDPADSDSVANDFSISDLDSFTADVQKNDVPSIEIADIFISISDSIQYAVADIIESDALTTAVKLTKTNKKIAGELRP